MRCSSLRLEKPQPLQGWFHPAPGGPGQVLLCPSNRSYGHIPPLTFLSPLVATKQALWRPLYLPCSHRLLPPSLASPHPSCQRVMKVLMTSATKGDETCNSTTSISPFSLCRFPAQTFTLGNQVSDALEKANSFTSS